jgi:hypothetical protein
VLNTSLKAFVKDCKALIRLTGEHQAHLLMQTHIGKEFVLGDYGLLMHMPAVKAELCLSPALAQNLHNMLCMMRAIKIGHEGH